MSQSNPPAGNRDHSDSGGHGVWAIGDSGGSGTETVVNAKFVEFKAHPETGRYIGKGVIVLTLKVVADTFTGRSDAYRYDATGSAVGSPSTSPVTGVRITLPAPAAGSTR